MFGDLLTEGYGKIQKCHKQRFNINTLVWSILVSVEEIHLCILEVISEEPMTEI